MFSRGQVFPVCEVLDAIEEGEEFDHVAGITIEPLEVQAETDEDSGDDEEITILIPTMQMMKFKLRRLKLRRNHRLQKRKRIVQHLPCSTKYQTACQDYRQFFLVLIIRYTMI